MCVYVCYSSTCLKGIIMWGQANYNNSFAIEFRNKLRRKVELNLPSTLMSVATPITLYDFTAKLQKCIVMQSHLGTTDV